MLAYAALEKLIDTSALNDSQVLSVSRTELSALLGLLNEALAMRTNAIDLAAGAMHEAVQRLTPGLP